MSHQTKRADETKIAGRELVDNQIRLFHLSTMRMTVALLVLVVSLLACTGPVPNGTLVNADGASALVFDVYGKRPEQLPRVWLVESDCADETSYGFIEPTTGACISGLTVDREDVYLVRAKDGRYSTTRLAHELAHVIGWHHDGRQGWNASDPEHAAIERANAALRSRPDLDSDGVGVSR